MCINEAVIHTSYADYILVKPNMRAIAARTACNAQNLLIVNQYNHNSQKLARAQFQK